VSKRSVLSNLSKVTALQFNRH